MIEPNYHPVWAKRAKSLQAWLRKNGPRPTDKMLEWAKSQKLTSSVVTNVLAYADGIYIQHYKEMWWAAPIEPNEFNRKVWMVEPHSSAECPAESVSTSDEDPESEPGLPVLVERPPDKPHPPT